MSAEASDDFVVPPPELSPEFKFDPKYNVILEEITATNTIEIDWNLLSDIIKYKLAEVISQYLLQGKPWVLAPEQAYEARTRAYASLDSFDGAPFTIQRLTELILTPTLHYRSLPKYLRALNRVLNVSSERNAYTEDDSTFASGLASGSGIPSDEKYSDLQLSGGVEGEGGMMIETKRPPPPPSPTGSSTSSNSSSRSSTPAPTQPLLSHIPWLIHSSPTPSSPSSSTSTTDPPNPPPSSSPPRIPTTSNPTSKTLTPTGGVIDEVDPGSGSSEIIEPVALTSTATVSKGDNLEVPGTTGRSGTSLRDRFVRAGSPRVIDDEEKAGDNEGNKDVVM